MSACSSLYWMTYYFFSSITFSMETSWLTVFYLFLDKAESRKRRPSELGTLDNVASESIYLIMIGDFSLLEGLYLNRSTSGLFTFSSSFNYFDRLIGISFEFYNYFNFFFVSSIFTKMGFWIGFSLTCDFFYFYVKQGWGSRPSDFSIKMKHFLMTLRGRFELWVPSKSCIFLMPGKDS